MCETDLQHIENGNEVREHAVYGIASIYAQQTRTTELVNMLDRIEPFFNSLPPARTAKIVRSILLRVAAVPDSVNVQVEFCTRSVAWCAEKNRTFLQIQQLLQARLVDLQLPSDGFVGRRTTHDKPKINNPTKSMLCNCCLVQFRKEDLTTSDSQKNVGYCSKDCLEADYEDNKKILETIIKYTRTHGLDPSLGYTIIFQLLSRLSDCITNSESQSDQLFLFMQIEKVIFDENEQHEENETKTSYDRSSLHQTLHILPILVSWITDSIWEMQNTQNFLRGVHFIQEYKNDFDNAVSNLQVRLDESTRWSPSTSNATGDPLQGLDNIFERYNIERIQTTLTVATSVLFNSKICFQSNGFYPWFVGENVNGEFMLIFIKNSEAKSTKDVVSYLKLGDRECFETKSLDIHEYLAELVRYICNRSNFYIFVNEIQPVIESTEPICTLNDTEIRDILKVICQVQEEKKEVEKEKKEEIMCNAMVNQIYTNRDRGNDTNNTWPTTKIRVKSYNSLTKEFTCVDLETEKGKFNCFLS